MNNTSISVIIPVYNSEKYLKQCLDSVVNQTYDNLEIIIVNDGSTDNSLDIIKSYKDKRIKLINKDNGGVSSARNEGLKQATGEYIMFVDSDDYISDNCIETFTSDSHFSNFDLIVCGKDSKHIELTEEIKKELSWYILNWKFPSLFPPYSFQIGPCFKLYKLSIIRDNKINFNEKLIKGEDVVFNLDHIYFINNMLFVNGDTDMYKYINNESSISRTYHNNIRNEEEFINNVKHIFNRYDNNFSYLSNLRLEYGELLRQMSVSINNNLNTIESLQELYKSNSNLKDSNKLTKVKSLFGKKQYIILSMFKNKMFHSIYIVNKLFNIL